MLISTQNKVLPHSVKLVFGKGSVWSLYRKTLILTVDIHRRMLWRCSASTMYANYYLSNPDTVIHVERNLLGFIQRLSVSQNSVGSAIEQFWHL